MKSAPSHLKAFKPTASSESSGWYTGTLKTTVAESKDTSPALLLVEATLVPGTEPPPHVHTGGDELFYVLEGELDVYVGKQASTVKTGESIFCPKLTPHGWVIRSPRLRILGLCTPGGLEEAFRSASSPAQSLARPTRELTDAKTEAKQTARGFSEYGVRFLAPDEVADQLPLYPGRPVSRSSQQGGT
jgi:quercetin dioxygenase-like cupin family protein